MKYSFIQITMSKLQEGMVAAPADTSVGVVTTSSESESLPATTTTSLALSLSPPLAQGEPALSDSEDSDTKVITRTDTATVSSASTMITPQEAATSSTCFRCHLSLMYFFSGDCKCAHSE